MRVPLAGSLKSRDGGVTRDAKVVNALIEIDGEKVKMRRRPGISDQGLIRAGAAQLLTYWDDAFFAITGDYINANGTALVSNVTTWNSADKGGDVTLSNGDLTATWTTNIAYDGVRSVVSKSTGRWYWEITLTASASLGIGVANITGNMDDATPDFTTANAIVYITSTGAIVQNNINRQTGLATATTADVIGVLLDKDAGTIQFYKNGVAIGTADSNLPTGALYAFLSANSTLPAATANFGPTFVAGPTTSSLNLSPSSAGLPFSAQDNGANAPTPYLMFKNASQAWTLDVNGNVSLITDVDYPGTYTVTLTSLTRSGSVATATVASDTNFQVGSSVLIAGAGQSDYNGTKVITGVTPSSSTTTTPVQINITRSGTTATATTVSTPHGYTNGQSVTISGAGQSQYNGTFTITYISATSFSFTVTVTGTVTSPAAGGSNWVTLVASPESVTVAESGNTATVTWLGHGLETGAEVEVSVLSIPVSFTGAITVTDANTFTLTTSGVSDFTARVGAAKQSLQANNGGSMTATLTNTDGVTGIITFSAPHHITRFRGINVTFALPSDYSTAGGVECAVTSTTTVTYPLGTLASSGIGIEPATPATGTITSTSISQNGSSFTFNVSGAPTTPATGTITATGGRNTVPGIAYMDGYFAVMDVNGVIYNSEEDNPRSWLALEYVTALAETGFGKAIARSLNYIVAFKEYSTEFFYTDPQNEVGSPFSPVPNLFTLIGCANGFSLADVSGRLLWIAQSKRQKGRSIYMMMGAEQRKVSTPDIERILDADSLTTVKAFGVTLQGHPCYVLTLSGSNITLVYDLASETWGQWSSLTISADKSITSITLSGTTATVTFALAHGLADGDPLKISGAVQGAYNGIHQVSYVSTTVITFETAAGTTTPATGTILGNTYTESYFKFPCYASGGGNDGLLHETDGHLYYINSSLMQDAGIPINHFARTERLDGGSFGVKKCGRLSLVATSASDTSMIRWSDDDCATYQAYRRLTLSDLEPNTRRLGGFKRRTFEYRHIGNTAPVVEAIELEIT